MNVRRGATDPLRSGETHPALSSPTATAAFGLGGYASPSQCSRWNCIANEGLSLMTDSQVSKAMNSSVGREARGGCASMMSDGAKP